MISRGAIMRILLIASSVMIIIGVILTCYMLGVIRTGEAIHIYLKDGETEAVGFKDLALVPGDTKEYHIQLEGSPAAKYDVKLSFAEKGGDILKHYLHVKVISGDMVICSQSLAKAFENDFLVLPVDFRDGKQTELTIVYHLPIDVGNEVKNAEAIFELQFTPSEK